MPRSSPHVLRAHLFLQSLFVALFLASGTRALAQATSAGITRCATANLVQRVEFVGKPKFPATEMALLIVNVQPSFLARLFHTAKPLCVDTLEVQRDALRLAVLHRLHGWFTATVAPRYDRSRSGLDLQFDITPGPEARVDTVAVAGVPETEQGRHPYAEPLSGLKGQLFDRVKVQAAVDAVVGRLRDAGYARATQPNGVVVIDTASASDSTPAKATSGVHIHCRAAPARW